MEGFLLGEGSHDFKKIFFITMEREVLGSLRDREEERMNMTQYRG